MPPVMIEIFAFSNRSANSREERGCRASAEHRRRTLGFAIPSAELANWESWLQARGIAVEEKRMWELGGWSLYFRDRTAICWSWPRQAFGRCIEMSGKC